MAAVYEGRAMRAQRIGGPLERLIYRGAGVDPAREMGWIEYALAMLWFNLLGALVVYALQRAAAVAAAQSAGHGRGQPGLVVQHRDELRHQHQLAGLRRREHDELPHADARRSPCRTSSPRRPGMAVLVALIRGFARKEADGIGNFWVDLVRSTVYILLPLSIVLRARAGEPGRAADLRQVRDGHAGRSR